MEPHATTVVYDGGKLTIHDKIQGVTNSHGYVTRVFGLKEDDVRVISPYVGGGFGSGLRPHHQLFLAVMASLGLKRSVRLELTRDQMFPFVHRPETLNLVSLGADHDGRLAAMRHEAIGATSRIEEHQEAVVNWSSLLYAPPAFELAYKLAPLDIPTPGDMRAPGAPLGVFAIESAMDELAEAMDMDPLALRLRNYAERDANEDAPFTSKELRACYQVGAERFGWSRRKSVPGCLREGRERIGLGMATGVWDAQMATTSARAVLDAEGRLEVASATADIGTGTYTILTQIAADALGLELEKVTTKLADTTLPKAPVEGGSWTAASAGAAVQAACRALGKRLLSQAGSVPDKPLAGLSIDDVRFIGGRIESREDPSKSVTLKEIMAAAELDRLEAEETVRPNPLTLARYSSYTHSAVFAEVRVDDDLGQVRVTRVVSAIAAGRILNPKTARSQIIGGVVWGIGMALHEETLTDHKLGRFMNHNLAEYHVPTNADIHDIDVIFVDERDDRTSPLGVKGLGEIGIVARPPPSPTRSTTPPAGGSARCRSRRTRSCGMSTPLLRSDVPERGAPPLEAQALEELGAFLAQADLIGRGGIMTDLDGTAVLEREGSVVIPDIVSGSLTDLARLGCRVSINTLRFPLNVIRTFGREWYAITNAPLPLVSLNGAQIGYLEERDDLIAFREIAAFPLSEAAIDEVLVGVAGLLGGGIDDILLFFYGRDWTRGERIWTPTEARATAALERYRSASEVSCAPLDALRSTLLGEDICMLMMLVNAEDDRLMAYQHVKRSSFVTQSGVDKKSGAEALARLLDQDLGHTIGAGDTPMDSFLGAVGLAVQVGERAAEYKGLSGTIRVADSLGLGALFVAAAAQLGQR